MYVTPDTLPPPTTLADVPLREGDEGTAQTVALMADLARMGARRPDIRDAAHRLHTVEDLRALAALVRFEADPHDVELIRAPWRILASDDPAGDCDDVATFAAALARARGWPVRFVTVAMSRTGPYAHVFVDVDGGRGWEHIDPTRAANGIPDDFKAPRLRRWPLEG